MPNIFNLTEEYLQLQREIETLEGEITDEIAERLKINEQEVEQKIKAYYSVIKFKEAEQEVYKREIERFTQAIKTRDNLIKRLKQTVVEAVELFGSIPDKAKQKALIFDTLKVSNKETESVVIDDTFKDDVRTKEEYEKYYNYNFNLILTPKQALTLAGILAEEDQELIPLSFNQTVVPKKDEIKSFYQNRPKALKINPVTNQLEEVPADPIPGTSIQHNLTPIFK
jgi:hypothetical protein